MNRTIFNCNKKEIQKINLIDNHLIDVNSPDKNDKYSYTCST